MLIHTIAGALGRFFSNHDESNDPLVRMFRTEYQKDYCLARKHGANVNADFVRDYLTHR